MAHSHLLLTLTIALLQPAAWVVAEAVKDREGAVRQDRATLENDARWIYNAIDGLATRTTEGELIGRLLQSHRAGENIAVTVLRGTERVTLTLPMQ